MATIDSQWQPMPTKVPIATEAAMASKVPMATKVPTVTKFQWQPIEQKVTN